LNSSVSIYKWETITKINQKITNIYQKESSSVNDVIVRLDVVFKENNSDLNSEVDRLHKLW